MAFGITRREMDSWKNTVAQGEIAFLTHYWLDPRFPDMRTVTKVGCSDLAKLSRWCLDNGLNPRYIHNRDPFPHFDLLGPKQRELLLKANKLDQLERFRLI
ncbi:hypothetical protein [Paenibacillus harenae]|uniref:Uncharacterized protein n=1 Tax=Paenibacillus harenae TaxID=306543 RepID=A0ABT9TWL0_PAEHA|nr:hypothetical protein [Paenibacillus harenae]MDQ0058413.1 hypothetical protein [Paenibacillus harenae]MDQ0111755.1 hypothetical protein [Paenibacillus harenae]